MNNIIVSSLDPVLDDREVGTGNQFMIYITLCLQLKPGIDSFYRIVHACFSAALSIRLPVNAAPLPALLTSCR